MRGGCFDIREHCYSYDSMSRVAQIIFTANGATIAIGVGSLALTVATAIGVAAKKASVAASLSASKVNCKCCYRIYKAATKLSNCKK